MKIAHIGDIHWGLNYPGPTPFSRFEDISRTLDWCADRIIEEKCDLVLVAGDMFKDARVFLDRASIEISAAVSWIRKIRNAGIEILIISGTPSHDAISAYELIKEMQIPGVEIHTEPAVKELPAGISVVCFPGLNRSKLVTQDDIKNLPPHVIHQMMTDKITETCQSLLAQSVGKQHILMAHITYDMADNGFEDVLMQHEPVLTREAVQGFDLVCLGHIHRPQRNENVFYCGSPERLSFNDESISPGFWIHELRDLEGMYSQTSSHFIETPARSFRTVSLDETGVSFVVDGSMCWDWSPEDDPKHGPTIQDAIVRIRYSCSEDLAKRLNRRNLEKDLYDAGAYYVAEIEAKIQRTDRARDQEVTESLGPVQAVKKWAENQGVDPVETETLQGMTAGLIEEVAA